MGKKLLVLTVIISGACGFRISSFCTLFNIFQVFYDNYVLLLKSGVGGGNNSLRLHREFGVGTRIRRADS